MFTVSVIVPNYNNEQYIQQCLESILAQTYPIKEIIVYDDCSIDGSKDILDRFAAKDNRIKVIYGKQNVGVSVARDTAIQNTTSEYVCMLDADDYFYSNDKIEKEMNKIEQAYSATCKKVIAFSQTVDVDGEGVPIIEPQKVDLSGKERFRIVTRLYSNYMPRDYCFPREYYDLCGGYTKGLNLYEDWELNIKLLQYTDFVYSGNFGTAYRHKAGGLSSVDYKKQLQAKIKIFRKFPMSYIEVIIFYFVAYSAYIKHVLRKERGKINDKI